MFYWSDSRRVVINIVLTSPLCCVNSYFKGLFYYINSPDAVFIHWCIVCYFNHHDLINFAVGQNINS